MPAQGSWAQTKLIGLVCLSRLITCFKRLKKLIKANTSTVIGKIKQTALKCKLCFKNRLEKKNRSVPLPPTKFLLFWWYTDFILSHRSRIYFSSHVKSVIFIYVYKVTNENTEEKLKSNSLLVWWTRVILGY